MQKSTRRWKAKACWVYKKTLWNENKRPCYIYETLFLFRKSTTILKGNIEEYIKAKYQDTFFKEQFEAINLLQKADSNKKRTKKIINSLQKANLNEKNHEKKLKPYIKMDKKIVKFNHTEIEKCEFYEHKSPVSISNIDVNKMVVSNKVPFSEKDFEYFTGYKMIKN